MGIKEEDLPDHYFPDDHPTRGTGNASSTGWTKANQKKAFFIVMAVVAVYIWHRRRYGHHQYDYIGNGMRFGGNGETGSIGNRFGSFTQHVASESEEKKLEAARFYFDFLSFIIKSVYYCHALCASLISHLHN